MCQSPSVSRVFLSRYSSVSTRLYPKISELFLLSNFRKVSEACPNSLKSRWKTAQWETARWKTAQPTAGWPVRTPANTVSSPSMAQSSTYKVLRAVELDWSLLGPTPLYTRVYMITIVHGGRWGILVTSKSLTRGHVAYDTSGLFWKIAVRLDSPYLQQIASIRKMPTYAIACRTSIRRFKRANR